MWNWFTILITILITHDFRTTKKPSKYWAFTAGDEGLEPLYSFLYRRNSFHVHAKHRINTGFFAFSITPKTKHLYRYATRCNTKCNEYGLITAALNTYRKDLNCSVTLPKYHRQIKELNTPDAIFSVFEGTDIELPVLLAMWLSFSMSEIRGLTKSKSISGDYITIHEVLVSADNKDFRKSTGKVQTRLRRHRMPPYIKELINNVPGDVIVPMTYNKIHHRFNALLEKSGLPHMSFHDLRHVNASVMAALNIPEKYAQERGGWKTPHVMKNIYTHTFSTERKEVDKKIDTYFESMMQHDMQHGKKKA